MSVLVPQPSGLHRLGDPRGLLGIGADRVHRPSRDDRRILAADRRVRVAVVRFAVPVVEMFGLICPSHCWRSL
jgi:hypothetical protein